MKIKRKRNEFRAAALKLIQNPQLLFRAGQKFEEMGVIGEPRNRLIIFLACLTKTLHVPVSVMMKGSTSSGKSNLVRTVIALFSPDCVIKRSSLSKKAPAHGSGDLAGKILYLAEYQAGKDAMLLLRLQQSEGELDHEFTTVIGHERGTTVAHRSGSPVVLTTTTEDAVYADDETRFLSLRADESAELTREVVRRKFRPAVQNNPEPPLEVWRDATRILGGSTNTFSYPEWFQFVADQIPADDTRARRDAERFIGLLEAVALCRAYSENRGTCSKQITINLADYAVAYEITHEAFASTYRGAHTNALRVAEAVHRMHIQLKRPITVLEVADDLVWERPVAYKWVKRALEHRLITQEKSPQPKNLKLFLPGISTETRFLPNPKDVLRERTELADFVRYIDPFTGRMKVLRRNADEDDDF